MGSVYKIAVAILAAIILFHLPGCSFSQSGSYDDEDRDKFDKTLWTINWPKGKNSENDRHFMLTDLTKNYLHIGMDSIEVKKLLGEPERDFGFSYNLGLYRSGFDPTFLILQFDKHGNLSEIKIATI